MAGEVGWHLSLIWGPLWGKAEETPEGLLDTSLIQKIEQHFTLRVLGGEL